MHDKSTPLSNPTFPFKLRPKVLRALPASAARFWPKISALGLPPNPLTPFRWGPPPPVATPPLLLLVSSPLAMPSQPACCVPLCMRRRRGTGMGGHRCCSRLLTAAPTRSSSSCRWAPPSTRRTTGGDPATPLCSAWHWRWPAAACASRCRSGAVRQEHAAPWSSRKRLRGRDVRAAHCRRERRHQVQEWVWLALLGGRVRAEGPRTGRCGVQPHGGGRGKDERQKKSRGVCRRRSAGAAAVHHQAQPCARVRVGVVRCKSAWCA
jgi:hypothetical protein